MNITVYSFYWILYQNTARFLIYFKSYKPYKLGLPSLQLLIMIHKWETVKLVNIWFWPNVCQRSKTPAFLLILKLSCFKKSRHIQPLNMLTQASGYRLYYSSVDSSPVFEDTLKPAQPSLSLKTHVLSLNPLCV